MDAGEPVCYLLETADGSEKTYVGATINVERRLRQHNGEISGGARATKGRQWHRVGYVRGFESWNSCLKFEWRWKYYGRKYEKSSGRTPMERRLRALIRLLNDWGKEQLEIVWEDSCAQDLWNICNTVRE